MSNKRLRFIRVPSLLLAGTALLCFATPVRAQSTTDQDNRTFRDNDRVRENDPVPRSLTAFDRFMDNHPDIAAQVHQKPSLLADHGFLQSHPDLNEFLEDRPQLNAEISRNPTAFIQLENRLDSPNGRSDLREFDRYLDSHRDVAEQLRQKPWLATNYQFLQSHPDLKAFLDNHPQLRADVGQNPVAFMQDERAVDRLDLPRSGGEDFDRNVDSDRDAHSRADVGRDRDADAHDHDAVRRDRDADARDRDADVRDRDANARDRDTGAGDRDIRGVDRDNHREVARFDRFLDGHREIAEQIHKNPSLVNDRQFVKNHPELQTFLQQNPGVREELSRNPNAFTQQDQRTDRDFARNVDSDRDAHSRADVGRDRDADAHDRDAVRRDRDADARDRDADVRDRDANARDRDTGAGDRDTRGVDRDNHREVARFDRFLDGHREIAEQLRRNPSLVNDHHFVESHPALQSFLQNNPGVRTEIAQNPTTFMQDENRFERARGVSDPDVSRQHMSDFHGFLNDHSDISRDISKNPSVVKDHDYVHNHPDLDHYLSSHPDVRDELMANPRSFVKGSQQATTSGSAVGASVSGSGSGTGTATSTSSTGTKETSPTPVPVQQPKQKQ